MANNFLKSGPLIVFSRINLNDPQSINLIIRLNNYAKEFATISPGQSNLLSVHGIECASDSFDGLDFSHLVFIKSGMNIVSEFTRTISHYRKIKEFPNVIIAGDPWIGFLKSYILKKFFFRKSRLQIQIHGDVYSMPDIWKLKEVIKYCIVRLSLQSADSIRVVSNFQVSELEPFVRNGTSFVCAPIPIALEKIPLESNLQRTGIGFIGRIHKERGLDIFVSILEELKNRKVAAPIFVIGDGPEKKTLTLNLDKHGLFDNVTFLGELSNLELREQYSKIKVLLTCAPSEGYGLTLREAALSGVSVVARRSLGSVNAKQDYFSDIALYDSVMQAGNLIIEALNQEVSIHSGAEKISLQKERDIESIRNWARTWID
jgi:glycosyltransferase involved in cell wall biosynthesis